MSHPILFTDEEIKYLLEFFRYKLEQEENEHNLDLKLAKRTKNIDKEQHQKLMAKDYEHILLLKSIFVKLMG